MTNGLNEREELERVIAECDVEIRKAELLARNAARERERRAADAVVTKSARNRQPMTNDDRAWVANEVERTCKGWADAMAEAVRLKLERQQSEMDALKWELRNELKMRIEDKVRAIELKLATLDGRLAEREEVHKRSLKVVSPDARVG
jgi:hypothetical protein